MTDIFFSYSSEDRERVRPVRDMLATQGFDVFWDQAVPAGVDWDAWIRQHLAAAKCVIVFWSANSVASKNVRHEATVADNQGKLVPVLLQSLTPEQFPIGLYSTQGANLASWAGNPKDPEWESLQREVEARLTPIWVRQRIQSLEARLLADDVRREAIASRDRVFQAELDKQIQAQLELSREKALALEEIESLKAQIEELTKLRTENDLSIQALTESLRGSQNELAIALQQLDEQMRRHIEQQDQNHKLATERESFAQQLKLSEERYAAIEFRLKQYESRLGAFEEGEKNKAYYGHEIFEKSEEKPSNAEGPILNEASASTLLDGLRWCVVIFFILVGLISAFMGVHSMFSASATMMGVVMVSVSVLSLLLSFRISNRIGSKKSL
jgi:hypothetical protein